MRRIFWASASVALLVICSGTVLAQRRGPVLHERIPQDSEDDVRMRVSPSVEASVQSPHGLLPATRASDLDSPSPDPPAFDGAFVPDRDTRAPNVFPSSDVFRPSIAPYKRLAAYDSVTSDFSLHVARPALRELPIHRPSTEEERRLGGLDVFVGEIDVEVRAGSPVRIPSVVAGSMVSRAEVLIGGEKQAFRLLTDGAENWFVETAQPGRARLSMTVFAPRLAFGGVFIDRGLKWADLPNVAPLPPGVKDSARIVLEAIGTGPSDSPATAVRKLTAYFRSFRESEEVTISVAGRDILQDLALTKRGVCRHRSFAFVVSALALGLPARLILNEEHAWVEVHNGLLWKRIDLGGGAHLATPPRDLGPAYKEPADPFAWPREAHRGRESGSDSAPGTLAGPVLRSPSRGPAGDSTAIAADISGKDGTGTEATSGGNSSRIVLGTAHREVVRGDSVQITGNVSSRAGPCRDVSVEILLSPASSRRLVSLGSLSTDARGTFSGSLQVPAEARVGDYVLVGRTLGGGNCGPSSLEAGSHP